MTDHDPVNHPSHYTTGGIETIDVIEAKELGFHLGNAVKYILRSDYKGARIEDIKKARWYLDRWLANEERKDAIGGAEAPPVSYKAVFEYEDATGRKHTVAQGEPMRVEPMLHTMPKYCVRCQGKISGAGHAYDGRFHCTTCFEEVVRREYARENP